MALPIAGRMVLVTVRTNIWGAKHRFVFDPTLLVFPRRSLLQVLFPRLIFDVD